MQAGGLRSEDFGKLVLLIISDIMGVISALQNAAPLGKGSGLIVALGCLVATSPQFFNFFSDRFLAQVVSSLW